VVLGRSAGLTDEQMGHLMDYPLPAEMFTPDEEAIIVFARKSALMQPIDDETYAALKAEFTVEQMMEICFIVGLDQMVSRMHALFLTDVDGKTLDQLAGSCQVKLPEIPTAEVT
jgi:alkylhydroperoxidase family enzyme